MNVKTLWKARWFFEKMKGPSRKLEGHLQKTRSYIKSWTAQDTECPLGDCRGEGEYITHQTDFKENDLELDPAAICDCGRRFKSLQGLHIHKACWCKQCNSPIRECKSNNGIMNLDYTHSVQNSIVEQQCSWEILSKLRTQWPKGNQKAVWTNLDQELSFILTTNLKGPIRQQISVVLGLFYFVKLYMMFALSDLIQ